MADFVPIATQIQQPDSFKTIGQVMGLAKDSQQLQSNRQAIESQGLNLLKQRQMNDERVATQQFMSTPDNFQTNGRIDLEKINAALPKIAPLTGTDTINHLTSLANAQTGAESAKQQFTTQTRGIVGSVYGTLARAGVDDPTVVSRELTTLASQYPEDKAVQEYVKNAQVGLQNLPANKGAVNRALMTTSQSLLSPTTQQTTLSPQPSLVNTGGQVSEAITQPAVGGNPASISLTGRSQPLTLGPESRESTVTGPDGNLYTQTKDAQGNIVSSRPAGTAPGGGGGAPQPAAQGAPQGGSPAGPGMGGGIPRFVPGQKADIEHAQQEVAGVRQAGDQVPTARNINQQILRLSRDTTTAPGSEGWRRALAGLSMGQFGDNYQELGKFLEKNALQQLQAMGGPPSNARLEAATAANGSTQFNPGALQAVTKFNDATTTALDLYRQGVDKTVGTTGSDYTKLPQFKADWAKNMDVDIFRVANAIRDGDQEELGKITKELGPAKLKGLAQKQKNLQSLSTTGRLP